MTIRAVFQINRVVTAAGYPAAPANRPATDVAGYPNQPADAATGCPDYSANQPDGYQFPDGRPGTPQAQNLPQPGPMQTITPESAVPLTRDAEGYAVKDPGLTNSANIAHNVGSLGVNVPEPLALQPGEIMIECGQGRSLIGVLTFALRSPELAHNFIVGEQHYIDFPLND